MEVHAQEEWIPKMPMPGGPSDKLGNIYEQYWTVRCFLDVMQGNFESIRVEPPGEDGFEFWLARGNVKQYHQVKAQHGITGKWTIADLSVKGVLQDFWEKLQQQDGECWFISMDAAGEIHELSQRARQAQNWNEFNASFLVSSDELARKFTELCNRLKITAELQRGYEYLQRVYFKTIDLELLKDYVAKWLNLHVEADTDTAVEALVTFALESIHKQLTSEDIWNYLVATKGFRRKTLKHLSYQISTEDLRIYLERLIARLDVQGGMNEYVPLDFKVEQVKGDSPTANQTNQTLPHAHENRPNPTPELKTVQSLQDRLERFAIIGEPGGGKTTLLRRLALDAARKCLVFFASGDFEQAPIPFLVELTQWKNEGTPEEFLAIQWYFESQAEIVEMLSRGHVRLYLDGLNEMGNQGTVKAQLLKKWLHGITESEVTVVRQPKYVVVTCRQSEYKDRFDLDIPVVRLKDLDESQIKQVAYTYLGKIAHEFLEQIAGETQGRSSLLKLARNPYLLAILLSVYQSSENQSLPRNPGTLFKVLTENLWRREAVKQAGFSAATVQEALSKLAFAMIDSGRPTTVSERYALLHIGSSDILQLANRVGLIDLEDGQVRFVHQLLQEYFAAHAVLKVGLANVDLDAITDNDVFSMLLSGRTPKWNQVIIALCGIVPNPQEIVSQVAVRNLQLALDCISTDISITNDKILSIILPSVKSEDLQTRIRAINALGSIRDANVIPNLIALLYDTQVIRASASRSLSSVGDLAPNLLFGELEIAISSQNSQVAEALLQALVGIGNSISNIAMDFATHPNVQMRIAVIRVLGSLRNKECIPLLLEQSSNDEPVIRQVVASALGNIDDPVCPNKLLSMLEDTSPQVRAIVAKNLGQLKYKKATQELIWCLLDKSILVHLAAFEALRQIRSRNGFIATAPFNDLKKRKVAARRAALKKIHRLYGVRGLIYALGHTYRSQIYWDIATSIVDLATDEDMSLVAASLNIELGNNTGRLAYTIGRRKTHSLADKLLPLVAHDRAFVRGQAIQALGELVYEPAIPRIVECLSDQSKIYSDSDERICDYAKNALKMIGTLEAIDAITKSEMALE